MAAPHPQAHAYGHSHNAASVSVSASPAPSSNGSSAAGALVDSSLATIMRLLTLEYTSPTDVEPRWKRFARDKRRDLAWVEKKRLDNAIWRAWNLWRLRGRTTPFFDFERSLRGALASKVDETHPNTGNAIAMTGVTTAAGDGHWERKLEAIKTEYASWRAWYKRQVSRRLKRDAASADSSTADGPFEDGGSSSGASLEEAPPPVGVARIGAFPDTLFSSLDAHAQGPFATLRDIDDPMTIDLAQPNVNVHHLLGTGPLGLELPCFAPDSWIHVGVPHDLLRGIFREAGMNTDRSRPGLVPLLPAQTTPTFNPFAHPSTLGVLGHVSTPMGLQGLLQHQHLGQAASAGVYDPGMGGLGSLPDGMGGVAVLGTAGGGGGGLMEAGGRRSSHIVAEQKRRNHIRSGFDDLQAIIPGCQTRLPNQKFSKATILQKAIDFISQLTRQKSLLNDESSRTRREICALKLSINQYQQHLAALEDSASLPTESSVDATTTLYRDYMRRRSAQDIKFWIFSTIADQLFETYNRVVHVAHLEALSTSAFAWIDQHCQLPTLRDCAVRSLRALAVCLFPGQAGLPLGVPLVAGAGVGLGMPGLLR